jgi:outer membrane protein assembly factor BamA
LKKFYMNHGYKDIVVGEPKVELMARNPQATTQKGKKYRMVVVIPVEEGKQFRMGALSVKGNTVLQSASLEKLYEVKSGKVYNYSKVEEGNEALRTLYQSRGYIYAYTNPSLVERNDKPGTVDVVVDVYERSLPSRQARVRRQHQDAGQGSASGGSPDRGGLDEHVPLQAVGVQGQPTRLLQAQGGPGRVQV